MFKKKDSAMGYHCGCEAVADLIVNFIHAKGINSIFDLLTKLLTAQISPSLSRVTYINQGLY